MRVSYDVEKVESLFNFLVKEIQKKFNQELLGKKAIIGLSGGIDSAVVTCLMVNAIGNDNVIVALLPFKGNSSKETFGDAETLAMNLGLEYYDFQIEKPCEAIASSFKDKKINIDGIPFHNVQARMRMIYLMALANRFDGVVINTCNLTEDMIGYNTMYGDSIGAFAPLGKVGKQAIFALADYINKKAFQTVIPQTIIDRKPSAELAPGQEDESDIGIPYSLLDPITQTYKNGAIYHCPKLSFKKKNELLRRIKSNLFKLEQAPPSISLKKIKMNNTCEFIQNKTCMKCKELFCPSRYIGVFK